MSMSPVEHATAFELIVNKRKKIRRSTESEPSQGIVVVSAAELRQGRMIFAHAGAVIGAH
jgi:hypothetical protein